MELTQSIEQLARRVPPLPTLPPKNFFDIAGVRNKEVINSRVLGYFLNPQEEHGLGTLFFSSLLDLIREKRCELPDIDLEAYSGGFTVEEEESTFNALEKADQRKRIDLVLKGESWAIIIENKLYHDVINPLDVYWDHLKKFKNKIGIILSLFDVKTEKYKATGFNFINITHKSLINKVSENFRFDASHNENSLFYLKEYFKTIQSHYAAMQNAPQMNEIVNKLISNKEDINIVLKKLTEAKKFVATQVTEVLKKYHFDNVNGLSNPARLFFSSEAIQSIFIAVNVDTLLTENRLVVHLAVMTYEQPPGVIDELKSIAISHVTKLQSPNFQAGTYSGKEHTHLLIYTDTNFLSGNENFDVKFEQVLRTGLFGDNGGVAEIKNHLSLASQSSPLR